MKRSNNHPKYLNLRGKFDFFEYQSYKIILDDNILNVEFSFNLSGKFYFNPKMRIKFPFKIQDINQKELNALVFNIGMIELISYWKTACPPQIIIRPHKLNNDQVLWWKKLYFNGLGEFFYLNSIDVALKDFVEIESFGLEADLLERRLNHEKVIVPVGGGKDSIVTLEILKNAGFNIVPMMLNANPARNRTIENASFKIGDSLIVDRFLDKQLLKLNEEGFLNGHTPFSALLGFTNVMLSVICGIGNIALSNENSANESTVPGTNINHQYSKSFEFEEDLNFYVKKYIHKDVDYFSFLRPLNEMQIASLFSKFKHHHKSFRSCNVGSKEDKWCGKCPKCLFTYLILSPFIAEKDLIEIFGKNLLNDMEMESVLMELNGQSKVKPFECVGTVDEVNAVIYNRIAAKKGDFANVRILDNPLILNAVHTNSMKGLMSSYNNGNNLPKDFEEALKNVLND